jgi:hypothetical protein
MPAPSLTAYRLLRSRVRLTGHEDTMHFRAVLLGRRLAGTALSGVPALNWCLAAMARLLVAFHRSQWIQTNGQTCVNAFNRKRRRSASSVAGRERCSHLGRLGGGSC